MNQRNRNLSIAGLRWVLGLVILLESVRFALSSASAHEVARIGLPQWLPAALGGGEAVAALLFLAPAATMAGGYALLFIFTIAAAIHILHGQYDVAVLVVYAMGVMVCMAHRKSGAAEAAHDRR